jgi:PAS domain S-box-containing protein
MPVVYSFEFEQEKSEKESEVCKEPYGTLFNKIQAAVVVHGTDTKIIASNPKAQELLGLTEAQMFGREAVDPCWKFLNSDGTALLLEKYPVNQVLKNRQELRGHTFGIYRSDKDDNVWVSVSADPVINDKGEIEQVIVTFMDITDRKQAEKEKENLILDLQKALFEVKTLRGILPICANCKKIRDDKGYWNQVESYVRDHTEATFSHSICPECAKKLYPDLDPYKGRD